MFYWKNKSVSGFRILIAAFLITCLAACGKNKKEFIFYPVDSLVTAQIVHLAASKAKLHKYAMLGEQADTVSYTPADTSVWVNELGIFRQLDVINKPVNQGSYIIKDGLTDPGSNLTVKTFTTTKKLPVTDLRIYYNGSIHKPRRIEALYNEENSLYKSTRKLSMEFTKIDNKTMLTSYSISGGQKMIFGDSVAFIIKGRIHID